MAIAEGNAERKINVHPADHPPKSLKSKTYDVIVIGSGQAGRTCAARAKAAGATSLVIEQELYGGDCPFWACVPSKALLRPAEALDAARAVGGAREALTGEKNVNVEAVFARRDAFVNHWDDSRVLGVSEEANVDIARGRGYLVGAKKVAVHPKDGETTIFEANLAVVIASGAEATLPKIPGLLESDPWLPRHAVTSATVPEHLAIMGAGVIGCEMATAYANFGGKVTLIAGAKGILPKCHPHAGKAVKESLTKKGVEIRNGNVLKVDKASAGTFKLSLSDGQDITASKILIAIGTHARATGVGLASVGVSESKPVDVDESLCVKSVAGEWLYAIGDANGRAPLTHMALYQARIAADTIIARSKGKLPGGIQAFSNYAASADHDYVPQVIFTDPTIASVGLSIDEANKKGYKAKEVSSEFKFPGAFLYGDDFSATAWASWVIDTDKNVLLGATFIGRDATDLLHASTVAIVGRVPLSLLRHAVPSFPTRSEIYVSLLLACGL